MAKTTLLDKNSLKIKRWSSYNDSCPIFHYCNFLQNQTASVWLKCLLLFSYLPLTCCLSVHPSVWEAAVHQLPGGNEEDGGSL